jgi:hypothetical protein
VLSGLPQNVSMKWISNLLWGGTIDKFGVIRATSESCMAEAIFTDSEGCAAYFAATPNGLRFKTEGKAVTVMVDLDENVTPVSSQLAGWLEKEFTRCVRVIGAERSWTIPALWRVAEGTKRQLRRVEHVKDETTITGVCGYLYSSPSPVNTNIMSSCAPLHSASPALLRLWSSTGCSLETRIGNIATATSLLTRKSSYSLTALQDPISPPSLVPPAPLLTFLDVLLQRGSTSTERRQTAVLTCSGVPQPPPRSMAARSRTARVIPAPFFRPLNASLSRHLSIPEMADS